MCGGTNGAVENLAEYEYLKFPRSCRSLAGVVLLCCMYAKTTPPKKKPSALPRKSALALTNASVISSPLGTKTFNFTMHGDDEEDYGGGLSPPKFNSGKKKKKKHANLPGDLDFGDAHGNEVADAKAEAEEQAKLVAEMLGEEMNAGDLAAEYGMSESSEEEPEEETKEEAKGEAKEFDWSEQMGPQMVSDLQEQNQTLKSELDSKKGQLKKMGIMLNALEPIPGVDAEKLMQALDHKGDPLMKDMKDVKIITMAKKIKGLSFEVNKQKSMNRKAEQVSKSDCVPVRVCVGERDNKSCGRTTDLPNDRLTERPT